MNATGVWTGLMRSALLSGLGSDDRRGLRLLATLGGGLLIGAVAAFAAWSLTMIPFTVWAGLGNEGLSGLGRAAESLSDPARGGLGVSLARLAVSVGAEVAFLLAFCALAARLAHRPLIDFVTAAARFRWRLLAMGMVLAALVISPMVLGQRILSGAEAPPIIAASSAWSGRALYVAGALLLIPAAMAEELFFRGWMLRQIAAFSDRTTPVLILGAILFAAAHVDFAPEAFLQRALMGGGLAYMALRLGGIEFPAGVHAMHNLLIVLFLQPLTPGADASDLSPFALLYDVALITSYVVITEAVVRVGWLRRLAGVQRAELSPPDNLARPA